MQVHVRYVCILLHFLFAEGFDILHIDSSFCGYMEFLEKTYASHFQHVLEIISRVPIQAQELYIKTLNCHIYINCILMQCLPQSFVNLSWFIKTMYMFSSGCTLVFLSKIMDYITGVENFQVNPRLDTILVWQYLEWIQTFQPSCCNHTIFCQVNAPYVLTDTLVNIGGYSTGFSATIFFQINASA